MGTPGLVVPKSMPELFCLVAHARPVTLARAYRNSRYGGAGRMGDPVGRSHI